VAEPPIRTRVLKKLDADAYAEKKNLIAVRHRHGDIVAIIEIVSPGNKGSKQEFRRFVEKTSDLIAVGVHVLVVDLFPPTARDPNGIHAALWDEDYECPGDKPLTLASYDAEDKAGYVESVAVGDTMPAMPIFLRQQHYVSVPLDETYGVAWEKFPRQLKGLLEA